MFNSNKKCGIFHFSFCPYFLLFRKLLTKLHNHETHYQFNGDFLIDNEEKLIRKEIFSFSEKKAKRGNIYFQEYERTVIFRLGRLLSGGARGPGVFFIIPCVDMFEKIDLRVQNFDVPPQEVKVYDI